MPLPDFKTQILDRLSFESFYQGELPQLKATSGGNHQALCPFHEDKNPSLSVNFKTGLFKCFACEAQGDVFEFYMRRHGCDFKEALAALGRQAGVDLTAKPQGQYRPLTMKEFALAKKLPYDFLVTQGVAEYQYPPEAFDGCRTVNFPYKDSNGKALSNRRRFGAGKDKFKWKKGDKTRLYGLWKLPKIRTAGWCLLVEGESDALTCWLHGLPAPVKRPGRAAAAISQTPSCRLCRRSRSISGRSRTPALETLKAPGRSSCGMRWLLICPVSW